MYPSSDIIEVQSAGPIALPKCYSQPACATASYIAIGVYTLIVTTGPKHVYNAAVA